MTAPQIREELRSGRLDSGQPSYSTLVIELYRLERGAAVEFVETTYDDSRPGSPLIGESVRSTAT